MSEFVHLHNHTDFSLLDAAQSVEMMCRRLDDLKMDTIAVTDHGNLFAMLPFYKTARKKGIKPILGCEVYVAAGSRHDRKQVLQQGVKKWGYHHLVLIVQNTTGYRNLMKLVSRGYLEGFYYRPRVDKELLRQLNEGLIASSACLAGEVTGHAARGDYEAAKKAALEYAEIFPGRFYLELQNHTIPEELASHEILKKLSQELGLPLLATNDNHYAMEEHWEAHDALVCIGKNADMSDPQRQRYVPRQFYIKSADEMAQLFKDTPQALENSLAIAEQCEVEIPMGTLHLPKFQIPAEAGTQDPDEYLRMICERGLAERYKPLTPQIRQRLDYELQVIRKMGFAGYFLITMDFVRYAKDHAIPVGPGRGSAAGSIVAYVTGITTVDPIQYDLLFERFLNPERVSMPDIDIDFCMEGRGRVIEYIKKRYGEDSVCQIITFGKMKAKSVVRDVGRVLGMSYGEVDRIAKLIPNELKMTLSKASEVSKELAEVPKIDEKHRKLLEYSHVLEGLHRHASTHAAGVLVAPGPLMDYIPLYKPAGSNDITTQIEMDSLEEMGLLKMDFLGLRNLTVIDKTVRMIRKNHGVEVDIENLNLNDEKTFELFAKGHTVGVFQFESGGMREYLKQLQPTSIHDLIAMNALYRPGPMKNIPEFIARKHGRQKISYLLPQLEDVLKETYGIIVYQEQVMQIASLVGGFTLAQADMMRRVMSKKKAKEMAAFKVDFVAGAEKQNIPQKKAVEIFDLLERFAEYGFNKSHSTAYAIVAYETAWLKVHYPAEFMAANMNSDSDTLDRVVTLINEARDMGIEVLAPDVNTSFAEFEATKEGKIAYGFSATKNIGHKAAEELVRARTEKGPYRSIFDLVRFGNPQIINRKVLESLVLSGACDGLEGHRAQQFAALDSLLQFGQSMHAEKNKDQVDLFGNSISEVVTEPPLPDVEAWSEAECLAREKELIGFYLSGNPLDKFDEDLREFNNVDLGNWDKEKLPAELHVGGIISGIKKLIDKKNKQWAILTLTGRTGQAEVFVFAKQYSKLADRLHIDAPVFVKGALSKRNGDEEVLKILADDIIPVTQARQYFSHTVNIRLQRDVSDKNILDAIMKLVGTNGGNCSLVFHLVRSKGSVQRIKAGKTSVSPAPEFIAGLRKIVQPQNVWID
ncbi:MAG: DNA polymerase III subunit alpha [FCB group bacterium]|nr:DNA polymerase III subunit alpha [FCB group bacterium]